MNSKALILCTMILCLPVMAQDSTYEYIFSGKPENVKVHFYGGLTFQHVSEITNTMPGIEGGVLFNKKFVAGLYGQGTTGNFGIRYNDTIHNIMFGEGGLFLGYISKFKKPLHFGGMLKIGYVSLVADDNEIKLFEDVDPVAEDNGMVFHPELFSEVNVLKQLKVRLGLGYTFNSLDKESVACNRQLDSWTMNFSILLGNFYR